MHRSRAPMIWGCAVRLGHTGVTATTSSPGSSNACMDSISPLTPPEVTATRSAAIGPCNALVYEAIALRNSGSPRL